MSVLVNHQSLRKLCTTIQVGFGVPARDDEWIRFIRGSRRAAGVDRIWLPGEKESEVRAQRQRDGIPLNAKMIEELRALGRDASVPVEVEAGRQ